MECCSADSRKYFLLGMRVFFGIWLLYVGLVKWIFIGPEPFVGFITSTFAATWSPAMLNTILAWTILVAEPLLGAWILSGVKSRCAWTSTALLMFMLTFGQTMLQKETIAGNWQYVLMALICAALSESEVCSAKA